MKRLAVIVPVSPFEPQDIVLSSARHLMSLEYAGFEFRIVYVVDVYDQSVEKLRKEGVSVLVRKTPRGKRAGAINDALKYLKEFKPDYVAIFDVDSNPEGNFIEACVDALEKDERAYIASSRRYVSNPVNFVSETIEAEYYLLNFFLKKSLFKQFNGLIGVLRANLLYKCALNESAVTEDADFATRMYARGYRAVLVDGTRLYEQAPVRWRDLLNQRRRWYYGGLQLWKYWKDIRRSGNRKFILSWMMSLSLTYSVILTLPLILIAPPLLVYKFRKTKKIFVTAGLAIHVLLLQYAATSALWRFVRKKGIEWRAMERVVG
jgi:cellulose synthase/poly-beta-1,6-N-acetylglucosamine synthase-like glycosyltransferase